ncbi:hypothetical protein K501DRAFT_274098 [Backusella circina FSU 941]|nr:hypothetical protein K501DRAFT_274098 [Backusella circina FSU 941]
MIMRIHTNLFYYLTTASVLTQERQKNEIEALKKKEIVDLKKQVEIISCQKKKRKEERDEERDKAQEKISHFIVEKMKRDIECADLKKKKKGTVKDLAAATAASDAAMKELLEEEDKEKAACSKKAMKKPGRKGRKSKPK